MEINQFDLNHEYLISIWSHKIEMKKIMKESVWDFENVERKGVSVLLQMKVFVFKGGRSNSTECCYIIHTSYFYFYGEGV